MVKTLVIFRIF